MLVLPIGTFMAYYVAASVPRPGDIPTNQVATIFMNDGESELARIVPPEGNRVEVTIDQIPEHVRNAVIAAEDRDFYTNPGFSVTGLARAVRDNVLGRDDAGGGSTITQQYVKNALVGADRTLVRKMRELVISTKMSREWSKDDILVAYLNTIYYGRNAYGIASAAQAYFGKPVNELTPEEGAVLAATIQQPSRLDPAQNPEIAEQRWNYVLDGMVEIGALDPEARANAQYPAYRSIEELAESGATPGPNGLIRSRVIDELYSLGITEQTLNTEGLQITTTIDSTAQDGAVRAAQNGLSGQPDNLRTAVVSIDPRSGAVKAYYGGTDGAGYDYAQAPLQTGSTFKVFGLVAALDQGIPVTQPYDSSPLNMHGITIRNVGNESCGRCTIAEALMRSLNTSFYRLMLSLDRGPVDVKEAAHKAGIPREIPGLGGEALTENGAPPNNGIVLGQYQVRPIDMASSYATLAASGVYHDPHFVERVVTADGTVLFDRGNQDGERRLRAAVADNTTSAMEPIAAYSNGNSLAGGRPSAAKTGTTQLGDTGYNRDAWMVGYTPSLSTAVWVGTNDGDPLLNAWGGQIYGSGIPSTIWKNTMDAALINTEWESFPTPEPIGGVAGVPVYVPPTETEEPEPTETTEPEETTEPPSTATIEIAPGLTVEIPIPGGNNGGAPEEPGPGDAPGDDPGAGNGGPPPGAGGGTGPATGRNPAGQGEATATPEPVVTTSGA
ncbi:penicillin-binding protein [Hoyosella sp. YIM 151337]|uniref:transglycosylase domain-containing protein n=1 Tax=Hoyosella sp. YIM 151337 TaxID=2992742 RepID=UPI002235CD61|nr:transglycosylase domain-containing protein [Hoyosella sp. YIM 151337]MCW4354830.1 penicillin-binding protein [Hoyosella sp. YIM 151337]